MPCRLNRHRLGYILIGLGVVAWLPYGIVKYGLGNELPVHPFLAWHLIGVVPGFLLRRGDLLLRVSRRLRPPSQPEG